MKQILRFLDFMAHLCIGLLAIALLGGLFGGCVFITMAAYDKMPWLGVMTAFIIFSMAWVVIRDLVETDG